MTGFFYSWRRKVGGVLLLFALALMGLWIRSRQFDDVVRFTLFGRKHLIQSCRGEVSWWAWDNPAPDGAMPVFTSDELSEQDPLWLGWGLGHGMRHVDLLFAMALRAEGKDQLRNWNVPDWALVWSLTLVSALLLFWKPKRQEGQSKTPPNPADLNSGQ